MMKFKKIHRWDLDPKAAIILQNKLKKRIRLHKLKIAPTSVAGVDVGFKKGRAKGALVVMTFPGLRVVEAVSRTARVKFPYVPGLLTFREGPVLEKCFEALKSKPDVIIFDGQGTAHPRNMGIAAHLGMLLGKPTIGCAKTRLCGKYKEPKYIRGAFSYLLFRGKRVGVVVRTQDNIKPVFVSPGYKMDIKSSIKIILACAPEFRLPQPLRLAHQLTQS